jgi:mono/diheme cytochrome c family protein
MSNQRIPPAFYALPASLLLLGILRAQAGPSGKIQYIPIAGETKAPTAPRKAPKTLDSKKPTGPASKNRTGQQLYQQLCASCHGANGEGAKRYKRPLVGDLSVGELAQFVHEFMPPDAKPKLPLTDARKVAEYIHGEFYSPIAQERKRPARVELSRLTVRQYRNVISDLIGSFRRADAPEKERGLRAKYYKTRGDKDPILERVDPEIHFDYGTEGALKEQDDPYQFKMNWQGSILAPDSGEYEFILRTDQGATLWFNDMRTPFIDGRIKSGDANEYRGTIHLIAGRAYPMRLEFFKGVTGVDNLEKLKKKPVQKASLSLNWKLPRRAEEVIPQRFLLPSNASQKFVLSTPFPPDDRSIGYDRGNSVSKEWDDATTEAALEVAGYVADNLNDLSGVKDDAPDRDAKLREFGRKFVTRAFRRPLTDDDAKFFVDRQFENVPNLETAIKRVVLLTLKSPRFLYRELSPNNEIDAYDTASRLAFTMWDSLPDEELLKVAAKGELTTREQLTKQAERMAGDARAWSKMRDFLLLWLKVDHFPDLTKDKKRFPDFDEAVASDLRASLEMTLEHLAWNDKADFRKLLLADEFYLNGRLAQVYEEPMDAKAPFQLVKMDGGKRSGILTHPYILASFSYLDSTSPIHRGVLIARNLLGRSLNPPPEAFTPLAADLHPKLTTRQRVALQTKPSACSTCHNMINPLGFSLEEFDATGDVRDKDNGAPIDATGGYLSRSGQQVKFTGARELANFLASSEEVHAAFVEKLFQNIVKQPIRAYGPQTIAELQASFKANEFNIRRQMIETAVVSALARRETPATTTPTKGVSSA